MSEQEQEQELTEEEVAAIDAEPDEPEQDGDEHEPESVAPEPEAPEAPDSQAFMEQMGKKLDLLQKHVAKRMTEIMGDAALEWEECEVCTYWNTPGWRHKGPLPGEVEDAVRLALGMHSISALRKDEYSRACERCDGEGFVSTGSKVKGQEEIVCLHCKGMGWVPIGDERRSGPLFTPNGPQSNTQAGAQPPAATVAPAEPDPPEVAALKARGYMVFAPPPAIV